MLVNTLPLTDGNTPPFPELWQRSGQHQSSPEERNWSGIDQRIRTELPSRIEGEMFDRQTASVGYAFTGSCQTLLEECDMLPDRETLVPPSRTRDSTSPTAKNIVSVSSPSTPVTHSRYSVSSSRHLPSGAMKSATWTRLDVVNGINCTPLPFGQNFQQRFE